MKFNFHEETSRKLKMNKSTNKLHRVVVFLEYDFLNTHTYNVAGYTVFVPCWVNILFE